MRYLLLLLLLSLSFAYSEDLYRYSSMHLRFEQTKSITFSENTDVNIRVLSFVSSSDSNVLDFNEYIISTNEKYYPTYDYDKYGNRYSNYSFKALKDRKYIIYGSYFVATNSSIYYNLHEDDILDSNFLNKSEYIIPNSGKMLEFSNSIRGLTKLETLFNLDSYIADNFTYVIRPYLMSSNTVYDSDKILEEKSGVCIDYVNFSAAVLRSQGIPSRIVLGIVSSGSEFGNHAWLEVEVSKDRWVPYDPTYHEYSYLNATHIKQAVFTDYSESYDKVTSSNHDADISYELLYNPFDINVQIVDYNLFNLDFNVKVPNRVSAKSEFEVCLHNDYNDIIAPYKVTFHSDFNLSENKLAYLAKFYCSTHYAPDVSSDTNYSYNINILGFNKTNYIEVLSSNATIFVKYNNLTNNNLAFDIYADRTATIYAHYLDENVRIDLISGTSTFNLQLDSTINDINFSYNGNNIYRYQMSNDYTSLVAILVVLIVLAISYILLMRRFT